MSVGWRLDVGLNLALGVALVLAATSVAEHFRGARIETGSVRLTQLDEATVERLASLRDRVSITYYVSDRESMPSHMRRVERDVTDLLGALADASDGRLEYQIVDPSGDQGLIDFAAGRRVTPVRIRSVMRDAFVEQQLWSTITINYGPRRPAVIRAVGPEHLPRLAGLIVAHLDQLEAPRPRTVALAAPAGFSELRARLIDDGDEVLRLPHDLEGGVPDEADVLLWMDPPRVDAEVLRSLDDLLGRGRSLVIAGSEQRPELLAPTAERGEYALGLQPTGSDLVPLYDHFGLAPVSGLLLDQRSRALEIEGGEQELDAPYRITCIANNQDFQEMERELNATVLFETPSTIRIDAEALADRGWSATVLGTTDRRSWGIPYDGVPIPFSELTEREGSPRPKEPLMVRLRHSDPWRGEVLVLAASTAFDDGHLTMDGAVHRKLAEILLETVASDDRIVESRAEIRRPDPLPALAVGERVAWRALCIGALPLVLGALVWKRRRGTRAGSRSRATWAGPVVLRGVCGLACIAVVVAWLPGRIDLTADGRNGLHPVTWEQAGRASDAGPVQVELIFSESERLPPQLRGAVRHVSDLLADIAAATPGVSVTRVFPEDLGEDERARLIASGVTPQRMTSHREEATTVRTVWSALRLRAGERVEVLPFADVDAFEHVEFRVAFAFWRLATGTHPQVVVAADTPRLSAAEAHEEYQKKHLIAPTGTDVYSIARRALEVVDFRVRRTEPHRQQLDVALDETLVWLQPRRTVIPELTATIGHLYRGGRALVALQHFNMQARQYRGRGFDFVHWPQPQTPDLDRFYLPDLGIEMVRDVLFDELSLAIDDRAQVSEESRRGFEQMSSSLPFVIRASAGSFDRESTITRGLGDQAFVWASRFEIDEARLASLGLSARTLITSSPKSWSYAWKGGWIPDELLAGPIIDEAGAAPWLGPQALALDVTGSFPWPERQFDSLSAEEPGPYPVAEPVDEHADGRLVLIGCSELFKDKRLVSLRPEFRGDHLLLNAVADLALPDGLSQVMARRHVAPGFGVLSESRRLRWRALVVFSVPGLVLAFAALRRLLGGAR